MRKFLVLDIGCAMVALAAGYALTARWGWVAATGLMGLLWLTEPWHGRNWVSTMGLLFFTGAAVLGVLLRLPTLWLLSSLVAALVAWDLDCFAHYLSDVADIRDEPELIKSHLRRLGITAGLGWFLGALTLGVQLTLDFIWTLVLSLLIIISLGGAMRYVQRESE